MFKGRALSYPAGSAIRPTAQRTRESLFDSLGRRVSGAVFADLYAGAGGVGIEALSRGARLVHFVESGRDAIECLQANLARLEVEPTRYRIHRAAVGVVLDATPCPLADATIVFADPPYHTDGADDVFRRLRAAEFGQLEVVVVEHRTRVEVSPPAGMVFDRDRRFGDTTLSYFVPGPDGE